MDKKGHTKKEGNDAVREILVRMLDAYGVDEKVRKERGIKTDDLPALTHEVVQLGNPDVHELGQRMLGLLEMSKNSLTANGSKVGGGDSVVLESSLPASKLAQKVANYDPEGMTEDVQAWGAAVQRDLAAMESRRQTHAAASMAKGKAEAEAMPVRSHQEPCKCVRPTPRVGGLSSAERERAAAFYKKIGSEALGEIFAAMGTEALSPQDFDEDRD
ncbi:hypothetical protein C1H76_4934 [Elsinoe australis]|uniref:Uncharacterized protein n=1 Tax=Elsinoe australis TaxID=40998 RepID=A0A4U7AXA4_9PEZI|nr:hypothetical protein C1H76_4934 [Elsinoe australis]